MARKIKQQETLDILVPRYCENKQLSDEYKKLAESDNKTIKAQMADQALGSFTAGDYTVKYITTQRTSINEERLLAALQEHNIAGVIKTKEYVDMEALESYLYLNEVSPALAAELASCQATQEVVQLRIIKKKKEN